MIRPPFPQNEAARLEVIDRHGLTDPEREDVYDRIASMASDVFDVPIALVSIVGKAFQCFRGAVGLDSPGTPRNVAFCAFAILNDEVMVVEDTTNDARFASNPLVTNPPNIRFYAGAPLVVGGHAVGTLCLIDTKQRRFSPKEQARLAAMAATVVDLLDARLDRIMSEAAENRRQELIDAMPAALAIWSPENRLADYNHTWKETFFPDSVDGPKIGDPLSEVTDRLGATGTRIFVDGVEADWRRRVKMEVGAGGRPYEISHRDGRWFSANHIKLATGEIITVISDASESKERQRKLEFQTNLLRSTLDNVDEGIALFDSDRHMLVCNDRFFRLIRLKGDPPTAGVPLCELLRTLAQTGNCIGVDADFFKTGGAEPLLVGERRRAGCETVDGRYLDFQASGCQDGMLIVVCADNTEKREIERLKDEFISTVSHELRTPLTSISGSLDILRSGAIGELSDKANHFIGIARKNSERLGQLVNDLLDSDKIHAGLMELDCKPHDLGMLLARSVEQNTPYADSFNVSLELKCVAEPIIVRADEHRLLQIAANLISNAVKHSPKGETVTISIEPRGEFGRFVVSDNGPGIPEGFVDQVFNRFAQADSSDHRERQGTGLGLSIARGLVHQHGGRIGFETEPGKGTSFHVDIPLAGRAKEADSSDDLPIILICLSDRDAAATISQSLKSSGARVHVVGDPTAARQSIEAGKYDCLLVDVAQPDGSNGLDLIRDLDEANGDGAMHVVRVCPSQSRFDSGSATDAMAADAIFGAVASRIRRTATTDAATRSGGSGDPALTILHVEDDDDLRHIVASAFSGSARLVGAPDVATAHRLLDDNVFDLVILDLALPDGNGAELLPMLLAEGVGATPVVIFSANEANTEVNSNVDATLMKSKSSVEELRRVVLELASDVQV